LVEKKFEDYWLSNKKPPIRRKGELIKIISIDYDPSESPAPICIYSTIHTHVPAVVTATVHGVLKYRVRAAAV